jgi:protein kinase-like protein/BACON domain-containing protein
MAGLQGRTLGGYQLTEQIASAGIAEVYRALPQGGNGREVVIKVIYPEFARYPSFLPNFQQIVQTAARIANHPHILPVVASGEDNGYLYLATPWVAEGTLRDWIARGGRLGVSDAGPFFQQLCSALAYAHSLGLVHGNLKPNNIFLFEGRHVLLGDFGMLWDIRQLDMNHSGSGVEVVEYLAPESFAGQFTQQSDIYSLGAILFATLTGRPPFSGSKPADLRDAHAHYAPPRLGQVDPSLPPGVQALDPIIQQAMSKNPQERFPSAMALAQAIDTILKQQPAMPPMHAAPALLPGPQPAQPAAAPMAPLPPPPSQQPGFPSSWVDPGPIPHAVPPAHLALPAPGASAMQPLDPPFPAYNGSQQAEPPLAQGWPAADGVQYTERVPAPQTGRPLFSKPQLNAPDSALGYQNPPSTGDPNGWGAPVMPAIGDDPEWRQDVWPAENRNSRVFSDDLPRPEGQQRRQAARDDDWRLARNSPSQAAPSRYDSADFPSEYTDQHAALSGSGYGSSSADWGNISQSGFHSQALRYRGGFSATELGLPRLTNPALQGELPPEWEDLLAGEMLPRRADVGPGISRKQPPSRRSAQDSFAYSRADQPYTVDRPATRAPNRRGSGANDGRPNGQPPGNRPGSQRGQPLPALESSQYPAYTANRMEAPSRQQARPMPRTERKRHWLRMIVTLVILLALVGGVGVVLAKPTLCPGTVCTQANHFLHKQLPFLGPAPNANVLRATPNTLTVHAVAGSSTNLNVQVSNSGSDPAAWHASANVTWLTITPSSGTLAPGGTATLSVVAMPADAPPGNYSAQVTVQTSATSINIPVAAKITVGPKISLSATSLNVTSCNSPQSFKVNNTGDGPLSFTATASNTSTVQLTNASGSVDPGGSSSVSFTINCSAFFGDYTISVASNGGNGTVTIHYT